MGDAIRPLAAKRATLLQGQPSTLGRQRWLVGASGGIANDLAQQRELDPLAYTERTHAEVAEGGGEAAVTTPRSSDSRQRKQVIDGGLSLVHGGLRGQRFIQDLLLAGAEGLHEPPPPAARHVADIVFNLVAIVFNLDDVNPLHGRGVVL